MIMLDLLTGLQFRGALLTAIAGKLEGCGLAACTQPTLSPALLLYISMVGPGELAAGNPPRVLAVCGDAGGPKPCAAAAAAWQLFITAKETEKCGWGGAVWSAPEGCVQLPPDDPAGQTTHSWSRPRPLALDYAYHRRKIEKTTTTLQSLLVYSNVLQEIKHRK